MSYVKDNLIVGEVILHEGRISRWIYFFPFLLMGGGLGTLLAINTFRSPGLMLIAVLAFIVGLFMLLPAFIRRLTTELSVTNKRVIGKTGFIRRQSIDVRLDRVESIRLSSVYCGKFHRLTA